MTISIKQYLIPAFAIVSFVSCISRANPDKPVSQEKSLIQSDTVKNHNFEGGIVFFSPDEGRSWQNRSDGIPEQVFLTDIAVSESMLAISTKQHGIYLYDIDGAIWKKLLNNPSFNSEIDALIIFENQFFAGSHGDGISISSNFGKDWAAMNIGLANLTVRKLAAIDEKLYSGTNGGLYVFDDQNHRWHFIFGDDLQINGIIEFEGEMYIGTNKGAFKSKLAQNNWQKIFDGSLHNIGKANNIVYALAYNELFASKDQGITWYSNQQGIPAGNYSFQLIQSGDAVFVGQWDGIYTMNEFGNWTIIKQKIPENAAITEMVIFGNYLVAASSGWIAN